MAFDIETAKPEGGGFDLSSARPVMGPRDVPDSTPEAMRQPPAPDTRTLPQRADAYLTGLGQAGAAMLTGAGAGLVGRASSIASTLLGGTGEGGVRLANDYTYRPTSPEAGQILDLISRGFDVSKLAGLGPAEGIALGNVSPAVRPAIRQSIDTTGATIARLMAPDAPEMASAGGMAGFGSAYTDQAALRRTRAAELPVPIDLTKGQATRDFAQQQFERETAKNNALGGPLRERYAQQNQKILQNFDAWLDQTGAEAGSLRATGETVTKAIADKADRAKANIDLAYQKAREAGAMSEAVDVKPLQRYLANHQAEAINAPILTSVEQKLAEVTSRGGTATINDLEEVRKMVGRLSGKDATNGLYGREVKGVIDAMTEDKGGDLYRKARALRFQYGREFEDRAVIDKLLSNKPGTADRAVAYEDVFNHSILAGSLDDVRQVRRVLQTAGPQGEQAWKELQGRTIQHIKDEITKSVNVDQSGQTVVSPAALNKIVRELDSDGKLDFIFGKQGAQQIRDVNEIAKDVLTAPAGSVNSSNTASAVVNALDKIAQRTTGVAFLGSATGYVSREAKNASIRRRVRDALSQ